MKKSIAIKLLLKLLFAAILIAWFLHKNDLQQILQIALSFPLTVYLIAIALMFILLLMNSAKWRLLLPDYSTIKLFEINLIGQYYGLILPGQLLGEGAKAYLLGKNKNDAEKIWISVLLDKVTGIIALFILGLFGILFTKQILPAWLASVLLLFICLCFLFLFMLRLKFIHDFFSASLQQLKIQFEKTGKAIDAILKFIDAWFEYTRKTKILVASILTGILCQMVSIIINIILSNQMGVDISFIDWCWIYAVVSVITLLPVTVGGIGLREGSLIGLLGLFQVSSEKALTLSFAIFSLQIIRAIVGGVLDYRLTLSNKNL